MQFLDKHNMRVMCCPMLKVAADEEGLAVLPCPTVPRGHVYPEEVSAQVCMQAYKLNSNCSTRGTA